MKVVPMDSGWVLVNSEESSYLANLEKSSLLNSTTYCP
jgi:hypothetical protein